MSLKSEVARSVRTRVVDEIPRPRATDLAIRLAEQVRRLRIQAGLTQAELAARAGVLRGRLSANANPSLETMERIGTALGVEVAELLSVPGKQKPRDDRLASVLRGVSAATKRRVIRVAEALVRDDRADAKPPVRKR
jgi:transcriptional regulator with XRE-family HTH domain